MSTKIPLILAVLSLAGLTSSATARPSHVSHFQKPWFGLVEFQDASGEKDLKTIELRIHVAPTSRNTALLTATATTRDNIHSTSSTVPLSGTLKYARTETSPRRTRYLAEIRLVDRQGNSGSGLLALTVFPHKAGYTTGRSHIAFFGSPLAGFYRLQ